MEKSASTVIMFALYKIKSAFLKPEQLKKMIKTGNKFFKKTFFMIAPVLRGQLYRICLYKISVKQNEDFY